MFILHDKTTKSKLHVSWTISHFEVGFWTKWSFANKNIIGNFFSQSGSRSEKEAWVNASIIYINSAWFLTNKNALNIHFMLENDFIGLSPDLASVCKHLQHFEMQRSVTENDEEVFFFLILKQICIWRKPSLSSTEATTTTTTTTTTTKQGSVSSQRLTLRKGVTTPWRATRTGHSLSSITASCIECGHSYKRFTVYAFLYTLKCSQCDQIKIAKCL